MANNTPFLAEILPALTGRLAEHAEQVDHSGEFPRAAFTHLRQHGLLHFALPASAGGSGGDLRECQAIIQAVARGEPSAALILIMQYLNTRRLSEESDWPISVREAVANSVVTQGALINALRVEPELGTPARGGLPATRARRTAEGWRISGEKIYSTGSHGLSWFLVWASSDDADPLVGGYLVPADAPGIRIVDEWDHLGMRGTCSHRVVLDEVLIPLNHAVNVAPWSTPKAGLNEEESVWMAVLLGSLYDAIAQSARDWFITFLQQRIPANLGAPLASLPRFQELVGRVETLLFTNHTLLNSAVLGQVTSRHTAQIKQVVTENAIRAVELMVESIGNHALTRHHPLQRHWRNVLCGRIHTPQSDAIFTSVGKAALTAVRSTS
ncbi:acyl-CoA/acyl-ACP dehydrogenase [Pantoea sp. S61]|uniref:acyl-CoA dehydrogenase family protein n=1 Tax=Pantoea sp. S61 TaxID=2767442 RepID=UPI00190E0732|nr:acyl-CoA dehydrogenase family protein [Pantoea sp. S61]MBK0122470.1 acyl-CoA/acyl-ACP dehydrogenase [Pantoea sp. S61]MBK0122821.1 acyl-CoA/acyl-ACP dehydrogenase [Pantoea sp. S61]